MIKTMGVAMKSFILAAALAISAASIANAQQCFRTHNVEGFLASDDEQHLYLRDTARHYFRVDFANRCTGLAYRERIVLKPFGTSDLVCAPADLDLAIRQSGIETKCVVDDVHALTSDELKALPKRLTP